MNEGNSLWGHVMDAGIRIAIGLIFWLICHWLIRGVVKRVKADRSLLKHKSLQWAQPVFRTLDTQRRIQRAETVGSLLNSILTALVVVVTGSYVLLAFNVNVAPLLTSIGIVGIAIGFGCQQLIRDFLAGIFITIEDQYGIGDVIETAEVVGTVESVGLRITRVRADDGAIWYLRNGEILRVGNRSQGDYVASEEQVSAEEPGRSDEPAGQTGGKLEEKADS